ncbi:MAG TPA: PAS domain-containing sensor histidine kinase [Herpetosiphonaceae bacterium]
MHHQPLARHIQELQRQVASLHRQMSAAHARQASALAALFATIGTALEKLRQIETSQSSQADRSSTHEHLGRTTGNGHVRAALPAVDSQPYVVGLERTAALTESEQARRYQPQIMQIITDNATAGLFMMDAQGRCTFMNPAAEQITGYTFAEIEGQILHDMIHHTHPDGTPYPMAECPIDRALPQNNQMRAHEDVFVRKDGTFFPVSCAASPIIKNGVPVGTVIEVRDITVRKRAEEERTRLFEAEQRAVRKAQQQAQQLRGLTAASIAVNVALSVTDVLQLITEQSRQLIGAHQAVSSLTVNEDWAQAITTISLSDKYAAWHDYHAPTNGSGIYAEVCRTNVPLRLTQAELVAHPAWRGFGAEAHAHPPLRGWLAVPLIGRDGRNMGVLQLSDKYEGDFTPEDESILVQLAQMASVALENARLYTAAQDAIHARNEFLSVASHELNTPITSLRGYAQLLIRQIDKGGEINMERMQRALRSIDQQSTKLVELINQLLDISRIESGRLILKCQPSDVAQLAREIAASLQATTRQHDLIVEAPTPIIATIDPLRLEQVLTNLIGNAIKYSPAGGPVVIGVAQPAPDAIEISVTDRGIGVSPEHRAHIFDRFYQAHGAGHFGGMGLGLFISQQIVTLHGGQMLVEFPPEGGTRFVIKLTAPGS